MAAFGHRRTGIASRPAPGIIGVLRHSCRWLVGLGWRYCHAGLPSCNGGSPGTTSTSAITASKAGFGSRHCWTEHPPSANVPGIDAGLGHHSVAANWNTGNLLLPGRAFVFGWRCTRRTFAQWLSPPDGMETVPNCVRMPWPTPCWKTGRWWAGRADRSGGFGRRPAA